MGFLWTQHQKTIFQRDCTKPRQLKNNNKQTHKQKTNKQTPQQTKKQKQNTHTHYPEDVFQRNFAENSCRSSKEIMTEIQL